MRLATDIPPRLDLYQLALSSARNWKLGCWRPTCRLDWCAMLNGREATRPYIDTGAGYKK